MKTPLVIPAPLLTLKALIRPLALVLAALCFSGCASTDGLQSRRSEPTRPTAVADDWDHHSAPNGEVAP